MEYIHPCKVWYYVPEPLNQHAVLHFSNIVAVLNLTSLHICGLSFLSLTAWQCLSYSGKLVEWQPCISAVSFCVWQVGFWQLCIQVLWHLAVGYRWILAVFHLEAYSTESLKACRRFACCIFAFAVMDHGNMAYLHLLSGAWQFLLVVVLHTSDLQLAGLHCARVQYSRCVIWQICFMIVLSLGKFEFWLLFML